MLAVEKRPAGIYVHALKQVTDIMVDDVTSPVAAARYYAYTTLAAYETLSALQPKDYPSFGYLPVKPASLLSTARTGVRDNAVLLAMWKTAAALLPSGTRLRPALDSIARSIPSEIQNLVEHITRQTLNRAGTDGFRQLNNLPRYTPRRGEAFWQPTGPAFMAPVEPHWRTIRTFLLDSASQFTPLPPVPFDMTVGSPFRQLLDEVHTIVLEKNPEKEGIARFWDCNPYHISQIGHIEFGIKKISPGGHWMGIAGIACIQNHLSLPATAQTHVLLALTLHDAFIACWDEKYRSHRVRPETAIRAALDKSWQPVLQTPPFPEYLSGHSVASSAAAQVLTHIFGPSYPFADDTELEFGLPLRSFASFEEAAREASISRLYGGIHFRDAIDQGIWQGTRIGRLACSKLSSYFPHRNRKRNR